MVTNNVTVYQFEVGLDEVFADEVRFRVNVDTGTLSETSTAASLLTETLRPVYIS